jgi:hypothetical protein
MQTCDGKEEGIWVMITNNLKEIHEHLQLHDWKEFDRPISNVRPESCKYRYCACGHLQYLQNNFTYWCSSRYAYSQDRDARQTNGEFDDIRDGAAAKGIIII